MSAIKAVVGRTKNDFRAKEAKRQRKIYRGLLLLRENVFLMFKNKEFKEKKVIAPIIGNDYYKNVKMKYLKFSVFIILLIC